MTIDSYERNLIYGTTYDNMFIPQRFMQRVIDHVVLNYLEDNHFFQPPLYLVIEGTSGQGKTIQTIGACNKKKIAVKYISASQLSGKKEAESREVLEQLYDEAVALYNGGIYCCILVDDFHMGNAITDDKVKKTINSNLLIGFMMNLADSEFRQRIPMVLTGNDFSTVYPALVRDGRADVFFWEPTYDEKFETIKTIYSSLLWDTDFKDMKKFYNDYKDYSVAFFKQLINDLRRQRISAEISKIDDISASSLHTLSQKIKQNFGRITLAQLEELAQQRIKAHERRST